MKKGKILQRIFYLLPMITVGYGFYIANNIWVAMFGYHGFAILILASMKQGYQLRRFFSGGNYGKMLFWSFPALLSGGILFSLGLHLNISESIRVSLTQMGLSGSGWLLFIVYYSLVNPVIEEVYWRGFLGSEKNGITWSDIGYGGYHPLVFLKFLALPWAILEFIFLTMMGWFWRRMVKKHDGLLIPSAMHLSADLSIAVAIWLLVKV